MNTFPRARSLLACAGGLVVVACVISTSTRPVGVAKDGPRNQLVATPVKAHMMDGDVVMFGAGVSVRNGTVTGAGARFTATRDRSRPVAAVPLDSVLGFEVYERKVNVGRTLAYGALTAPLAAAGAALLAVAISGRVPPFTPTAPVFRRFRPSRFRRALPHSWRFETSTD